MDEGGFDWPRWARDQLWPRLWARCFRENPYVSAKIILETEVKPLTELAQSLPPEVGEILRTLWEDDFDGSFEECVRIAQKLAA